MITSVDLPDSSWDAWRIGPMIIVQAFGGEFLASLAVCYNQADRSSAVITVWQVDGAVTSERLLGTNSSWDTFWEKFLDVLPEAIVAEIAHSEMALKV